MALTPLRAPARVSRTVPRVSASKLVQARSPKVAFSLAHPIRAAVSPKVGFVRSGSRARPNSEHLARRTPSPIDLRGSAFHLDRRLAGDGGG